jgi:hypothetical protein
MHSHLIPIIRTEPSQTAAPSKRILRSCLCSDRKVKDLTITNRMRTIRAIAPTFFALSLATVAHAQGTMDFSGAQTLMGTFRTFAMYAGAVICLGGLIFAGIRMMSGRFQDAIPGLFGALFGAGVLGWGAGWIGSLTGQQM